MSFKLDVPSSTRTKNPLIALFAARPVTLLVLIAATVVIGMVATGRIKLEMMPAGLENRSLNVEVPLLSEQSSMSPKEVEARITLAFEGELSTIPGIESLRAQSDRDEAEFDIEFSSTTDLDIARAQVRDRVERAKVKVSEEIGQVRIRSWDASSMPLAFVNINWGDDVEEPITKLNQLIIPAIESANGVSRVNQWGDQEPYYRIELKNDRLAAHPQVDVGDLMQRLRGENFRASAGRLKGSEKDTFIIVDAAFDSLQAIKDFPVSESLKLSDIAVVREAVSAGSYVFAYARDEQSGEYKGGQGVWAMISKTSDSNTVEAGAELERILEELRNNPNLAGFNINTRMNQGEEIVEQLATLQHSMLIGGILAVLVLLIFLKRLTLALIIALAIPLSMLMALVVMFFAGETLSLFALMGFTIAGGMLIDNAIVASENIYRRFDIDKNPAIAAVRGAGEVGLALTLATSTTVVVFLAVIFFSGEEMMRFFMARIGFPICFSLVFSVIVALAIVPHAMLRVFGSEKSFVWRMREHYHSAFRWCHKRPAFRYTICIPSAFLFGRSPEIPASTAWGDRIDALQSRKPLVLAMIALGLVLGFVAGKASFEAAGGEEFYAPLESKYEEIAKDMGEKRDAIVKRVVGEDEAETAQAGGASGSERGMRRGGMRGGSWGGFGEAKPPLHPSLLAILTFFLVASLPLLVLLFLPRKAQAKDPLPVVGRMGSVYGQLLGWLQNRTLLSALYLVVGLIFFIYLGGQLMKETGSNSGNSADMRLYVRFPDNIRAGEVEQAPSAESDAELPPEWAYFFEARYRLFGIQRDGKVDREQQRKSFEKFGMANGALSINTRGIRVWITLDKSRIEEGRELERLIKAEGFPEAAGFSTSGSFDTSERNKMRILLRGAEFSRLEALADAIVPQLASVPGLINVTDGTDDNEALGEAAMYIDRARAMAFGVEPNTLAQIISFQLNGSSLNDFQHGDVIRPVLLVPALPKNRAGDSRESTLEDVKQIGIGSTEGRVAVSTVTHPNLDQLGRANPITRQDRQTTLTLTADMQGASEDLKAAAQETLDAMELPAGYSAEVLAGDERSQGGRRGRRGGDRFGSGSVMDIGALLAAGLLVFLVMGFLFESLTLPLVVLFGCVPGAIAGAIWSLVMTDTMFDPLCALGLVVLVGVAVNNGIVLVDLINRLRLEGHETREAIMLAGQQRLRPMLMTSLTTIAGVMPMAWGAAEFVGMPYYPLGRTILGGMIVSTLVTLLSVPLFYSAVISTTDYLGKIRRYFFTARR